jgi:hypothetical protein
LVRDLIVSGGAARRTKIEHSIRSGLLLRDPDALRHRGNPRSVVAIMTGKPAHPDSSSSQHLQFNFSLVEAHALTSPSALRRD